MKRGGPLKRTPFKRKPSVKKTKRKSKLPKPKVWSNTKADNAFSLMVRARDGQCLFPNCKVTDIKKLQCSHYEGRAHSATRYDFDNCISLCWLHHFKDKMLGFEYQKQEKHKHGFDGQYTLFMKKWLGKKRYELLTERRKLSVKRSSAILEFMSIAR